MHQSSRWTIRTDVERRTGPFEIQSPCLILCTGSSPTISPIPIPDCPHQMIDLDIALRRSVLATSLPNTPGTTIAVIGASHSAVVILMNLFNIAISTHDRLRVKWFARRPLQYAEYKDGWILRDNTGLKGEAASFARENLEDDTILNSPVGKCVEKIDCSRNERAEYEASLRGCTHIVQAIGFCRDPIPRLTHNGAAVGDVVYDHKKGGFMDKEGRSIPGLYGAGIAFPEKVTDPAGNTEYAVGIWKFMKFVRSVIPEWSTTCRKW